jgi:SM-20-related protein
MRQFTSARRQLAHKRAIMSDTARDDDTPAINPALDAKRFVTAFAERGRVHIPNVLSEGCARRLHSALASEISWRLFVNDGSEVSEFESVSAEDYRAMTVAAWARANSKFQYFYNGHRLYENDKLYVDAGHYLARFVELWTAPAIFSFIRAVTGLEKLSSVSATATLYRPLDFLTIHDDGRDDGKSIAYVLNLTPKWRPDWGGALQFFDRDDHIEEAYLPTFNALNLFRVPALHSVAQVSAFGGMRYAISGWFGSKAAS